MIGRVNHISVTVKLERLRVCLYCNCRNVKVWERKVKCRLDWQRKSDLGDRGSCWGTFTWVLIPSLFSLRLVGSSLVWGGHQELMMTMLRMAKDYAENDLDNVDDHYDGDDNDDFQRQLLTSASASASAYWQQLLPTVTTQQQLFFFIICYIMMTVTMITVMIMMMMITV